jgi:hypothetical protein
LNWDAVGAVAELIGAVGVIASLVYLASQIRQNTSAMRGTAQESFVTRNTNWAIAVGSSPNLADVLTRGHRDYDSLPNSERLQYGHMMLAAMLGTEATFHQHKRGQLEEAIWLRSLAALPTYAPFAGFRSWWSRARTSFTTEFREVVDAHLEQAEPRQGPPAP